MEMNNMPINGEKVERDAKGRFLPGHDVGKIPKKKAYNVQELKKAIEEVEKGQETTLLKHFIKQAYSNDHVLIALIKKLVPDISITEINDSIYNVLITQFVEKKEREKLLNPETVINKGVNDLPPSVE